MIRFQETIYKTNEENEDVFFLEDNFNQKTHGFILKSLHSSQKQNVDNIWNLTIKKKIKHS